MINIHSCKKDIEEKQLIKHIFSLYLKTKKLKKPKIIQINLS